MNPRGVAGDRGELADRKASGRKITRFVSPSVDGCRHHLTTAGRDTQDEVDRRSPVGYW